MVIRAMIPGLPTVRLRRLIDCPTDCLPKGRDKMAILYGNDLLNPQGITICQRVEVRQTRANTQVYVIKVWPKSNADGESNPTFEKVFFDAEAALQYRNRVLATHYGITV